MKYLELFHAIAAALLVSAIIGGGTMLIPAIAGMVK